MEVSTANQVRKEVIRQALNTYVFVTTGQGIQGRSIIPKNILSLVLTDQNMVTYFLKVFTHMSADYENSYEQLEFGGDLFGNIFTYRKMLRDYPYLTPEESNNMLSYYKSNEVFATAIKGTIYNVNQLILTASHIEKSSKIYGDVFEALLMAVFITCNIVEPGIGFSCAENVFLLLTRNIKIEDKFKHGHPKSAVLSILGTKSIASTQSTTTKSGFKVSVELNQQSLNALRKTINKKYEAMTTYFEATGGNKEVAVYDVYSQILKELKDREITPETFQAAKLSILIDELSNAQEIYKKMDNKHEVLEFIKKTVSEDEFEWSLVAKDTYGKRYYIAAQLSSHSSSDFPIVKKELLDLYVTADPRDAKSRK